MKLVAAIVLVLSQVSLHSCRSSHSVSLVHDTSSELALVAPRKVPSLAQLIPILEGLDPPESKISKLKKLIPIYDELNKWRLNNKKRLVEILPFKKKVKPLAFILSGNDHYKLKNPIDESYSDSDGHKTESHIDSDSKKIKEIRIRGHKHSGHPHSHRTKPAHKSHNSHGLHNSHGSHKNTTHSSHSSQHSSHSHNSHKTLKKDNRIALPNEEASNSIELHPKRKEIGRHAKESSEDSSISDSNEYTVSHESNSSESGSDSSESGSYSSEFDSDSSIDSDSAAGSSETDSGKPSFSYTVSSNEPVSSTKTSQAVSGTDLEYDYDSMFTEPFLESTQSYLHSDSSTSESEYYPGMSKLRKSDLDLESSESDLISDLSLSENESFSNHNSKSGESNLHSVSSVSKSASNVESNESESVTNELSKESESMSNTESKESKEFEANVESNESESITNEVSRESGSVSNTESNVESKEFESITNKLSKASESVSNIESNGSESNVESNEFQSVTNKVSREYESVSNVESNESESNILFNESQSITNEISREFESISNVKSNEFESVTNEVSRESGSVSNVESNESVSVTNEVLEVSESVSNSESKESNVESNESEYNVKSNESESVTNEVSIEPSSESNVNENSEKKYSDSVFVSENTESVSDSESNQHISESSENFVIITNMLANKHHENDDSGENDAHHENGDQDELVVAIESISKEHQESDDTDHIAESDVGTWGFKTIHENDFVPELIVDARYIGSKHQQNDDEEELLAFKHTTENHPENVDLNLSGLMNADHQDNNDYDAVELVSHLNSEDVIRENEQEVSNWRSTYNNQYENKEHHISGSAEDEVDNKHHKDVVSDGLIGPTRRVTHNYNENYDDTGSGEETVVATNRHMVNNDNDSSENHENNYADENLATEHIHIIKGDELVVPELIAKSHHANDEDQILADTRHMAESDLNDVSSESDDKKEYLVLTNIKKYNRNHDVGESIVAKKHYKEDDGDQLLVDIRHMPMSDHENDNKNEYLVDIDTKKYHINDNVGESATRRTAENHENHKNNLILSQHMAKNQHENEKELVVAARRTTHDKNDDSSASDDGDAGPIVRKYHMHDDKTDGVCETLRNANLHRHRKHGINVNHKKAYRLSFIFNK